MVALTEFFIEATYEVVEAIGDALAENPSLENGLFHALNLALSEANRMGGAIYLSTQMVDIANPLIICNPGNEWETQVSDSHSLLMRKIEQVIRSGEPALGGESLDLAAILPLSFKKCVYGALLIRGQVLSREESLLWERMVRPFCRAIHCCSIRKMELDLQKGITSLKIFANSFSANTNQADDQLWILRGIKELLKGEAAILHILDDEKANLVVKKVVKDEAEWHSRDILPFDKSLAVKCIRNEQFIFSKDAQADQDFSATLDTVEGMPTRTIFCAPLISARQVLGVVEIINMDSASQGPEDLKMLEALVKLLAESLFRMILIQKLRVFNADLEASRWELFHSRNTLRTLFDSFPASIYIIDSTYTLLAINMSRAERVNNLPNVLVGKKCYEALFQRSTPCQNCQVIETLAHGKSTNRTDLEWINADRAIEWDINTFAIQELDNQPDQAIILEQDVTEKRRLESILIQNEKLSAVGQLAAGVAHEINNPLSAIIANTQLIMRDLKTDDEDIQESLKLIVLAGRRATQVVQNLLGFTHKTQFNYESVDLNETIQESLTLIQHQLISHSVTMNCDLQKDMPKTYANRDHLLSVWVNMMMNAIAALVNDDRHIYISTSFKHNEYRIIFQDNGQGINPEIVSRIFEPFYTTKATGEGTGLGLSVCHRVIKQHSGYITVESQVGQGTMFTIVLPRKESLPEN